MNFWTKPFKHEEMTTMSCSDYWPGRFSDEGSDFSILEVFLKFNTTKKICDPVMLIGAMLANRTDGWNEGLSLIQQSLRLFLINSGKISEDFNFDLTSFKNRIELHSILIQDLAFIRKDLRLELIRIIEGLE